MQQYGVSQASFLKYAHVIGAYDKMSKSTQVLNTSQSTYGACNMIKYTQSIPGSVIGEFRTTRSKTIVAYY